MKAIQRIIRDVPPHWVGDGFPVRSMFSYRESADFDPFLLLDYAAPYEFGPASAVRGVGEHPHRGFETVTIVYQGELAHRDSAGHRGSIGPGDVQWMTAAAGVVHEEFHSERFARSGGTFEVAQLWVNLPASEKLSPPRYQEILAAQIPQVLLAGGAGSARVIAGELEGQRGPARTFTPVHLWDVQLQADAQAVLPLPDGYTTILLVQRGSVRLNDGQSAAAAELVLLDRAGGDLSLAAEADARFLLLCGQPLGEPVAAYGPFVMNTPEQIEQAFLDYQAGRMGRLAEPA
jgi:redox-sensitive bicupin YhaK (pirin superfamily)